MMLIRTLGLASKGSVNPQEVFLVMTYSVMGHIPTLLTLSLFISLISILTRMMHDSEMVIWLSSGKSLFSFLRPLFTFFIPIFITIAVMFLLVWPWTNAQMQALRERFENRGDLERVTPGQFQESANGKRVFYVDKQVNALGSHHVFIAAFDHGKESITSAQNGHTEMLSGEKYLVLGKGQRLELDHEKNDLKLVEFETMGQRIHADTLDESITPPSARSSLALIRNPTHINLGELAWRLSFPLAAMNFVILALAMSSANARSSKSGHLAFAMLTFIAYYNFISVANTWIASGLTSFGATLIGLHGGAFLMSMAWLARRQYIP